MADVKISALPAATTPLDGTELAPIVQSGTTKRVTVANLTVGRALTASSLTLTTPLSADNGGTGQSSYAIGDLLYASGTTALSKLADVATGNALISGGVGTAPSWGKVGLTTHVSGTLPVANGGTGITSFGTGVATALGNNTNGASGLCVQDASGNLGLGVTPSAWTITPALQVKNASILSEGNNVYLTANAYYGSSAWTRIAADYASQYYQLNGAHVWRTAGSSTAGSAITFTQAMTLDASSNLTVSGYARGTTIQVLDAGSADPGSTTPTLFSPSSGVLGICCGGQERARIDSSGYYLINTTNNSLWGSVGQLNVDTTGAVYGAIIKNANRDYQSLGLWNAVDWSSGQTIYFAEFANGVTRTARGSITYNGTNTLYNQTSDQRLKTNIQNASNALELIGNLKVRQFDWIESGAHTRYGFVAQELYDVAPEAVTIGDDDISTQRYWQVDNSVIVPHLVKAIQELSAKLDAAEARIAALETN